MERLREIGSIEYLHGASTDVRFDSRISKLILTGVI